jgi:hypothetical protein
MSRCPQDGHMFRTLRPSAEEPAMAEPPDHAPAAAGRGRLRASDADREQVIDILKAAFVRGMLTKDEFDLRVSQAFASRTGGELAAFVADLPAGLAAAQPPGPARAQGQARVLRFGAVIAMATMIYAAVWPLALVLPRNSEGEPQAAIKLLVMTTFAYLMISVLAGLELLESRQAKRSGARPRRRPLPCGRTSPPATWETCWTSPWWRSSRRPNTRENKSRTGLALRRCGQDPAPAS